MRRFSLLLAAVLVSACSDATAPSSELVEPDAVTSSAIVDQIHAAALSDIGIAHDGWYRIVIPDDGLRARSAVVRYYSAFGRADYRFELRGNEWIRGRLLERAAAPSGGERNSAIRPQGYSQTIARLYNEAGQIMEDDWLISNLTAADRGTQSYTEEYVTDLPYSAEFVGGTETSNDTTFEVQFPSGSEWRGERIHAPTDTITCTTTTCDIYVTYTGSNGFLSDTGAERVTLKYYLYVVTPVSVAVTNGPTLIELEGNYTWTAAASGGDGSNYSYQWEEREQGGTWAVVGSGSSYTRFVSTAEAGKTYELRVTATSGGRSANATHTYQVSTDIEPPLEPTISGTSSIEQNGTYTWTVETTGGSGSYSYVWEYCQNGCTTVSTTNSYSRYVAVGDGEFTLHVTVTASAGQQQTATDSHYVYVAYEGGVLRVPSGGSK